MSTIAKINSFLESDKEIMSYASIKLYTTNKKSETWLYSDLQGIICLVFDFKEKVRHLILYDVNTIEVLFKYQLYFEFDKYYQILSEDFHSFEVDSGIIGLKFSEKKEANKFTLNIIKYDDMYTIKYFKSKNNNQTNQNEINTEVMPFLHKCMILKNKLIKKYEFNTYYLNSQTYENPTNITLLKRFFLLLGLKFDTSKKRFTFDKLSQESKNFFKSIGIRKSDFNNIKLALVFLKQVLSEHNSQQGSSTRKRSRVLVTKGQRGNSYQDEITKRVSLDHVVNNIAKIDNRSGSVGEKDINKSNI